MLIKKLLGVTVRQYRDKSVISSVMRKHSYDIHIIRVITLDRYGQNPLLNTVFPCSEFCHAWYFVYTGDQGRVLKAYPFP